MRATYTRSEFWALSPTQRSVALFEWLQLRTIAGGSDPLLDPINETTLPEVNQDAIEDEFFLSSVFQAHLRSKCLVPFEGGAFMRNLQLYGPLNGGAYAKGIGGFNLTKPLTISSNVFDPRYYVVMVIEYLEDISVLNTGDLAVFSLLETDMANAYLTMSTIMALDLQQNGQIAPRTINMNGWVEFLNNGVDYSYDGNAYTTYGTAQRNGAIGAALNGNTYWGGQTSGAVGSIQYAQINAMYITAKRGQDEPDLFTMNKPLNNFVENRIQQQQRFGQEGSSVRDPFFGAMGFRFKNLIVMVDDYFPSSFTAYGKTNNPGGVEPDRYVYDAADYQQQLPVEHEYHGRRSRLHVQHVADRVQAECKFGVWLHADRLHPRPGQHTRRERS